MKKNIFLSFVFLAALSCSKGNGFTSGNNNKDEITVTGNVIDCQLEEVTLSSWMNAPVALLPVIEFGIELSRKQDFSDSHFIYTATSLNSGNDYTISYDGLISGFTYYYRSFVRYIATSTYQYGKTKSFTTKTYSKGDRYSIKAVDLGLSVKWSNLNIGALIPEDQGSLYAWGETSTKSTFDYDNYKYCDTNWKFTKYCCHQTSGKVDNKTTLEAMDDAATANWGGTWKMPTKSEIEELKSRCVWESIDRNGELVYLITGPSGRSIIIPLDGFWSSTLNKDNVGASHWAYISSRSLNGLASTQRCNGNCVRPVKK